MTLALAALAGNWAGVFVDSLPLLFVTRAVTVAFLGLVVRTFLGDIARQTRTAARDYLPGRVRVPHPRCDFRAAVRVDRPDRFGSVQSGRGRQGRHQTALTPAARGWDWRSGFTSSFITLTTVGYGDITPIAPAARSLVILEALLGQFFVAVLVARLVGLLQTQLSAE